MRQRFQLPAVLAITLLAAPLRAADPAAQKHPDVIDAKLRFSAQPFTGDLFAVKVPRAVKVVVVQARDQRHGDGGKPVEIALPGR